MDIKKSEIKLQSEIFKHFHNNFPNERGLLCYNLNNSANKIQGNQNKALGLIAGRSDMVYYRNGKATMIELKTIDGIQSKDQKNWENVIKCQGFDYYIIRTLDEFIELLTILQNN